MKDKTPLSVDIRKTIDNLDERIEQYREHTNRIWQGVLRLIITLAASLLLLTIALVEKIFGSSIPRFVILSWILSFASIIFGIIAEVNEAIFFSNLAISDAKKRQEYEKLLCEGQEIPYFPPDDIGFIYNDIRWGVIAVNSFFFAVLFMCIALLGKIIPNILVYIIAILGAIFVAIADIYFIRKRKTG